MLISFGQRIYLEAQLLESIAHCSVVIHKIALSTAYSYSELPIANACLAPVLALEVAGRIARSFDQASDTSSTLTSR